MDPLKPFGAVVRSAWSRTTRRRETSPQQRTDVTRNEQTAPPADAMAASLDGLLRMRLASQSGPWNEAHARTVFVDCVLAAEIGEAAVNDPNFATLVRNVSEQLGSDAALASRLDELLRRLAVTAP